ncbi:uncharacterized protein LOC110026058 [Phalaenopsis equestris]|uniref:uncharacterized protein LOC110026058 n=1 Tax=Phalaenopsis equestris TaxID=78828 RepID=UPI0009E558D4|nr:uncharacterized protein LOC110026058 [Phalaenopsis equestris]
MFSRTRSIFHIEEEGEWDFNISEGGFAAETDGAVGLQIITKHGGIDSKALFSSAMKKKKKKKKKKPVLKHLSADHFLKFCCACSKELSLQNEVYMYRRDQGFCSVECRYQQILEDERKELDSNSRLRIMRTPNYQHERSKIQESSKRANIFVAA